MVGSSGELAIDMHHVAKTYRGKVRALRGIEMKVRRGELFGLLGPNGAGKSTLVKIMMTVVRPTRAEGTVLGHRIGHRPTLARLGYLPENPRFPLYLTGRQALEFYAALAKVDRHRRRRRSMELLEMVGLKDWAKRRIGTYSKGMQQRLGLAQALVNGPELIVLDEPTDGLDPVGRRETRELLKQLCDEGTTVFLNSHMLGEVEQVCDRVAILVGGKVVHEGTVDDLTARTLYYEIVLAGQPTPAMQDAVWTALACKTESADQPARATGIMPVPSSHRWDMQMPHPPIGGACKCPTEWAARRGTLPSGEVVEVAGARIRIVITSPEQLQPVIDALRKGSLVIESVRPVRQSLEDFFMAKIAQPAVGQPAARCAAKGGRS